jgi:hypothetical protein
MVKRLFELFLVNAVLEVTISTIGFENEYIKKYRGYMSFPTK